MSIEVISLNQPVRHIFQKLVFHHFNVIEGFENPFIMNELSSDQTILKYKDFVNCRPMIEQLQTVGFSQIIRDIVEKQEEEFHATVYKRNQLIERRSSRRPRRASRRRN